MANNDLKRVGLIFKEEGAVDFKKTLQDINIEMNKNYNQFKLTQSQWDNSTKSTEKLKAQQEYLTNAYEIQSDKVNVLKRQLEELENSENKNTTAIKKKQNELTNAEIKLKNYETKLKEVQTQLTNNGKKIEEWGEKVEKSGQKIENAGKKLSAFSAASISALTLSAKSAIDFEDAFTGVEKTVDGTTEEMEELKQGIRDMAKEIPSTTTEISAVAEAAGQLGIKTEDILSFTRVMIDLGNSTNISAEEAASALAKFANITNMSAKDYDKLGATIVELGNNFATTEADIVAMAQNLASAGTQVGMSQSDIMALATALSSVGLEAQAGGTAFSKALVEMQLAVETNSEGLKDWADVAGMSTKEFAKLFKEDATSALEAFIKGLSECGGETESAIKVLDDMGITETRMRDALLRSANASETFTSAIEMGNEAWEDNTALTNEANKRYDTLKSKITIAVNKLKDMAITVGNKLMPHIEKAIDKFGKWIEKFKNLSDEEVDMIVKIGLIVAAVGPLVTILGKVTSVIGGTAKGIGTFTQAIGVMKGTVTTTSTAVTKLVSVMSTISANPVLAVGTAVTALTGALIALEAAEIKEKASLNGVKEAVKNQVDSWKELEEAKETALSSSLTEISVTEHLVDELDSLVDENGKVKDGYENRVQVILNQLNKALGTEYDLNGNLIDQYKDLKTEVDKLVASKKAEAVLNAYQEEYAEAIKKQQEAVSNLINLKQQLDDVMTSKELNDFEKKWQINNITQQIKEQTEQLNKYGETIQDYENLQVASINGVAEEIEKAISEMGLSWEKAAEDTNKSLEEQIASQAGYMKTLKEYHMEALKDNDTYLASLLEKQIETQEEQLRSLGENLSKQTSMVEQLTPEQVNAWKQLSSQSLSAYNESASLLPIEIQKKISEATGVIINDTSLSNASATQGKNVTAFYGQNLKLKQETKDELSNTSGVIINDTSLSNASATQGKNVTAFYGQNLKLKQETKDELSNTSNEINNDTQVKKSALLLARYIDSKFNSNIDGITWGKDMVTGIGNGMESKKFWLGQKTKSLASTISAFLHFSRPDKGPLREYEKWMPDMIKGLSNTLKKSSPELINSVKSMSDEMANEIKSGEFNSSLNLGTINSTNSHIQNIDYSKLEKAITSAMTNCKFTLDEDGFAKIVKDEMYKVV